MSVDIGGNLLEIDVIVEHRVLGVDLENLEAASSCDALRMFSGAGQMLLKLIPMKRLPSKALSFSFSLLKPHGELTLGQLEVLDVGGSAVEKRDLAGLLVGDRKRVLEATVTLPEFVAPTLLRLDVLTTDLLLAPRGANFIGRESDWLEIIVVVGIGGKREGCCRRRGRDYAPRVYRPCCL